MRPLAPALLVLALSGACTCAPAPTKVTFKATNTLDWDIFVSNGAGEGGMVVQRAGTAGAEAAEVPEGAPCPCMECANACSEPADGGCACAVGAKVHRIKKGESFTRTFAGEEHEATRADCGSGDLGPVCFQAAAPLASGSYLLHLCFAADAPGASAGSADFPSTLTPSALTCVDKAFRYPDDRVVEIQPVKPPPCGAGNACPAGQICQRGLCSATCLASGVPPLGAAWSTSVTVTDQAFFTSQGNGRLVGTGAVSGSTGWRGTDLALVLNNPATRGTATVEVLVPAGTPVVPFSPGETVSVLVVDKPLGSSGQTPNAAVVVRDAAGQVLLAADMGLAGPLLSNDELTPFTVQPGEATFACDATVECGKRLHRGLTFAAGGAGVPVEPGASASLPGPGGSFRAVGVADFAYELSRPGCGGPVVSYALVREDRHL